MSNFPWFALGPKVNLITLAFLVFLAGIFWASPKIALAANEPTHGASSGHAPVNPNSVDSALKALKEGNARFAAGQATNPRQSKQLLTKLAKDGQTPLAAVLACSDSRVPIEKIFDQGFGDLFVIRAAGAVPGVDQVGSIEYAVEHLGTPLVLVLAHTQCGAVTGAVTGTKAEGALGELLAKLNPVARAVESLSESNRLDAAIKMSASLFREQLILTSKVIGDAVKAGHLKVISGVYDISTGVVEFTERP